MVLHVKDQTAGTILGLYRQEKMETTGITWGLYREDFGCL